MAVDLSMPVLVVDDYNTMIRIIRNLLKQIGFDDIDDAADVPAALARMREKKYGLVISDWNMEPMTGYELLKEVRADPGLSKTPFIMVTAESKTENVIAAKKAGVNNYIVKPFNAQTLQSKIEGGFPAEGRAPRGAAIRSAFSDHRIPSWPGIAVRRTASLRSPMSRPSTSCLLRFSKAWMLGTTPGMTAWVLLPRQPAGDGARKHVGFREYVPQHGGVGIVARAQLLGVNAGGHEQAIDAEGGRPGAIGPHRSPRRAHTVERRPP